MDDDDFREQFTNAMNEWCDACESTSLTMAQLSQKVATLSSLALYDEIIRLKPEFEGDESFMIKFAPKQMVVSGLICEN